MMKLNMMNVKSSVWLRSLVITAIAAGALFPCAGYAATLSFQGDKETISIGDSFIVDVKINSEEEGINAAQATVKYNQSVMTAEKIDKTGSVFNFWLAEPSIDNTAGKVSFIGGSSNGISGKSLQVVRIYFKVRGAGSTRVTFDDAAVTASDGTGTNVLTKMYSLDSKSISTSVGGTILVSAPTSTRTVSKPAPIIRKPETAKLLPVLPEVNIPLYPDPKKWYNTKSKFNVLWVLPKDVIDVATEISKNPIADPEKGEGLFDNKLVSALDDGIWYFHLRYKNTLGWGPVAHYRIAIDTVPPTAFLIESSGIGGALEPLADLTFSSTDQLSTIEGYYVRLDAGEAIRAASSSFTLPSMQSGEHVVEAEARDKAGNITFASFDLIVKDLPSPQITSSTHEVYAGDGNVMISGMTQPSFLVLISLKNDLNQKIVQARIPSLEDGAWSWSIPQPLTRGTYQIEAIASDGSGATSLPTSEILNVKERPVIIIFGYGLTFAWVVLFMQGVAMVVLVVAFIIYLLRVSRSRKRTNAVTQDVNERFQNLKADIESLEKKKARKGKKIPTLDTIKNEIENDRISLVDEIEEIG